MAQRVNNNNLGTQANGSAPSSPSMSQSQQPGGQSRQPVSYPSPTSYPSPGLSSAQYAYPAPNNQPVSEPYRASQIGSNGSLPLPSMRSLDPLQQQPHPQHLTSPLPPPVAQMAPYYHGSQPLPPHPQHQYPNVTSDPTGQNMRYALPAPDNRVMSGGRHKKEIKRRTKTGCLTCRKRRIKCDEAHPTCRNCQKSKRECLGYDPIFKQQPGPAAIQPAPSSAPPQPPVAAPANPYGNQPSIIQGYTPQVPNMGYEPALSAGVSSPGSSTQQFDYTSAIDPALEAVAPPAANANQFQQPGIANFGSELKTELPGSDSTEVRAKPASIDELLVKLPPKTTDVAVDAAQLDEIKHIWYSIYVPGLENFLETKWFSGHGTELLTKSKEVLDQFVVLLECFAKTASTDPTEMQYTANVEARVVWSLASLVASADAAKDVKKEESATIPAQDDAVEAAHRLAIFEDLICGRVAASNPLTKAAPGTGDHHRMRELDFWFNLGQFVTLQQDTSAKEVDDTLAALRNLLDGRENRDVLYSIAVVNALGQRISEYSEADQPLHLDEQDAKSKLLVAKRFVKDEANGNGTTNVIRRLCELATRSWGPARPTA